MFEFENPTAYLAEHVWEHMAFEEGIVAARNCYKYLADGGISFIPILIMEHTIFIAVFKQFYFKTRLLKNLGYVLIIVYYFMSVCRMGRITIPTYLNNILILFIAEIFIWYSNSHISTIGRSLRFDTRNSEDKLGMVSIVLDAKKTKILKYEL